MFGQTKTKKSKTFNKQLREIKSYDLILRPGDEVKLQALVAVHDMPDEGGLTASELLPFKGGVLINNTQKWIKVMANMYVYMDYTYDFSFKTDIIPDRSMHEKAFGER